MKISQIENLGSKSAFPLGIAALCFALVPISTLGFELPKLIVLCLVCLGCALHMLISGQDWLAICRGSMAGKLLLILLLLTPLSLLWSVAPVSSLFGTPPRFEGVLTHLLYLYLGIYCAASMQTKEGRLRVNSAIVCANIAVVSYGVVQMLQLDPLAAFWRSEAFLGRIFSSIGQPNALGQFVVLTAPIVVRNVLQPADRFVRMLWGALLIFNGAVLLGTVSRSALLAAMVLALFCAPSFSRWLKKRIHLITAPQAFAIALITVLTLSVGFLFFTERFSLSIEGSRSISARGVIWNAMQVAIAERPMGYGLETMAFVSPRFVDPAIYQFESLANTVDRAHNGLLQEFWDRGMFGVLTVFTLVVLILGAAWKATEDRDSHGLLRASAAGILGYHLTLLFGFPAVATGTIYWMLMGICIGVLYRSAPKTPKLWKLGTNILTVCIALFYTVTAMHWGYGRFVHAKAKHLEPKNALAAQAVYIDSITLFPHDREMLISSAESFLRTFEQLDPEGIDSTPVRTIIAQLRSLTGSNDGMVWLLEAWLAATLRNAEAADTALAEAITFLPESAIYHRAEHHIYGLLEDKNKQERAKKQLMNLLPEQYYEEGSELQRILHKQHPWLLDLVSK